MTRRQTAAGGWRVAMLAVAIMVMTAGFAGAQPMLGPPDPTAGHWEGGGLWPRVFVPLWSPHGQWDEIGSIADGQYNHRVYLETSRGFVVSGSAVDYWMAYDSNSSTGKAEDYVVLRQHADCSAKGIVRASYLAILMRNPYVRINPDDMFDTRTKPFGGPKYISLVEVPPDIGECGKTLAGAFGVAVCKLVRKAACEHVKSDSARFREDSPQSLSGVHIGDKLDTLKIGLAPVAMHRASRDTINCSQVRKYLNLPGRDVHYVAETMVISEDEVKKCQNGGR